MHRTAIPASILGLCILAAAALHAGPLNPPAGPVASSYKTLSEVEPRIAINATNTPGDANSLFRIASAGSYYLTGDITGVAAKSGIEIGADNVTIDLMGFTLQGVAGSLDGVTTDAAHNNLTVRNGVVRDWVQDGVDLGVFTAAQGSLVEHVLASNNTLRGIALASAVIVRDCTAAGNGGDGILTSVCSTVTGCTAQNNGAMGIETGPGSHIAACACQSNTTNGVYVDSGTVTDTTSNVNGQAGIFANLESTLTGCTVVSNAGNGIITGGGCTITGCSAIDNGLDGIRVLSGSTVSNCSSGFNTNHGINAGSDSVVIGNMCDSNGSGNGDGIRVVARSLVRDNCCSSNGSGAGDGAGIHAIGGDNRIEGNNCTGADRGIDVDLAGNIIIRNTCSGNTINWVIVANNVCGPILDRTAPASAAISGNSAASSLGSTDANANYTF